MKRFEMGVAGFAMVCSSCGVDRRDPGLHAAPMGGASANAAPAPVTAILAESVAGAGGAGPSGATPPGAEGGAPPVGLNGSGDPSAGNGSSAAASGGASGASGGTGASGASAGGASGASGGGCADCVEPACLDGLTECLGVCVDLSTSAEHCGFCEVACGIGQACEDSLCVCSGVAFPCVSENHTVETSQYGVLNLAAYRDATRDWVAYSDTNGVDAATLRIHDVATATDRLVSNLPSWEVQLAFLPNEPTLLFSNADRMYRFREGTGVQELALPTSTVDWFELSPDGTRFAVWDFSTLGIYAYPSLALLVSLDVSVDVVPQGRRLGFSNDGTKVAISGGYDTDQIQVFDLSSGTSRVLNAVGATGTYSPTFSLDGTRLYVGGGYADGRVYVFDTTTGNELRRLQPFDGYLYSIDRVPGFDQLLVGGYDSALEIISAADGSSFWRSTPGALINRAIFSPDGRHIYIGTGAGGGGRLIVLDVD